MTYEQEHFTVVELLEKILNGWWVGSGSNWSILKTFLNYFIYL
jgi:hypothetical protein